MLHQKLARLSLCLEEDPSGLWDFEPAPWLPVGIQSPAKGVVNKLFIVLKLEGLPMLLFQVKGAALCES